MKFFTTRTCKVLFVCALSVVIMFVKSDFQKNFIFASENQQTVSINVATGAAVEVENPKIPNGGVQKNKAKKVKKRVKKKKKIYFFSTTVLNVRKKATKKSPKKFILKPGQKVQVLKIGKKWAKIRRCGKSGYVLRNFLIKKQKTAKKMAYRHATKFRLTGYYGSSGTMTKSGRIAKANHTIAADLSVLPLYTEVYIEGMGTYIVEDIGGAVKGKKIDIFFNTRSECYSIKKYAIVYKIEG